MNANGAKSQNREPLSSWKGADTNFPSSTDWCVKPWKETEPDLPRNGSIPSYLVTGTLEFWFPCNSKPPSPLETEACKTSLLLLFNDDFKPKGRTTYIRFLSMNEEKKSEQKKEKDR